LASSPSSSSSTSCPLEVVRAAGLRPRRGAGAPAPEAPALTLFTLSETTVVVRRTVLALAGSGGSPFRALLRSTLPAQYTSTSRFGSRASTASWMSAWLKPKYSGPAMAVFGGGGKSSPAWRRASISELMRFRIAVQQPVQLLARSGSSGRSSATTRKVGNGQCSPPLPMMSHSCTQSESSATEDLNSVRDLNPSGKM